MNQQINLYEARLRPRHELATGRNLGICVLALLVLMTALSLWVRSEANRKSAAALAAQQQLTEEQAAILDNPVLGIFKVSHRVTVWANHAFAAMLGYTVEEVIGQPSRVRYVSEADYQRAVKERGE